MSPATTQAMGRAGTKARGSGRREGRIQLQFLRRTAKLLHPCGWHSLVPSRDVPVRAIGFRTRRAATPAHLRLWQAPHFRSTVRAGVSAGCLRVRRARDLFLREAERATSRFATFKHAIRSTQLVAPDQRVEGCFWHHARHHPATSARWHRWRSMASDARRAPASPPCLPGSAPAPA